MTDMKQNDRVQMLSLKRTLEEMGCNVWNHVESGLELRVRADRVSVDYADAMILLLCGTTHLVFVPHIMERSNGPE